MKRSLLLCALCLCLMLGACASTPTADPNYTARLEFIERQAAADRQQMAAIAQAAERCSDDACVTQVAALAALASVKGGNATPAIEPYRKQFHPAWSLLGAIVPQLANAAVSWHQSDNSRDVSVAQFGFLGGVVRDVAQSPALDAPNITVGGDYVSGSQHIGDAVGGDYITGHVGDAVGRDQIGGNQHLGDTVGRDQVGGDSIGGDRVDGDGNYNTGRIDSPGPFDNSNDGDDCEGDGCQGSNNPPPDEPEDGG
jgi:hypothetical protein